ncbi:MAG: hypothetical protein J6O00_10870 [Clostridiales bacterium]|nr:hypothetical protein [Clostridiales bacterium]
MSLVKMPIEKELPLELTEQIEELYQCFISLEGTSEDVEGRTEELRTDLMYEINFYLREGLISNNVADKLKNYYVYGGIFNA